MTTIIGFSSIGLRTGTRILTDKELAIRDLRNRFQTRKGERLGFPEYGSILPELVFDPSIDLVQDAADSDVREAIDDDPRWSLVGYEVNREGHNLTLEIQLIYLPDTSPETLVVGYRRDI